MITATLKNYRQSPRKVRLVANLVKGKSVSQAELILTNLSKRASSSLLDVLKSALSNAKNNLNIDPTNLFVKDFRIDGGVVMKRIMPVSRGMAHPIKKRTSHVTIVLAPKEDLKVKKNS